VVVGDPPAAPSPRSSKKPKAGAAAVRAARGRTGAFRTVAAAGPSRPTRPGAPALRKVTVTRPRARTLGRLHQITAIIMLVFTVIAVRLVEFQVRDAPLLAERGLQSRLQPVDLPAPRGSIIDRNGAVLAGSVEARYIFADPSKVENPAATADILSPLLGVPRSDLIVKLTPHLLPDGRQSQFDYLARAVGVPTGDTVQSLGLPGIGVRRDEARVVPGHDLAANLIGFTGTDLQGLGGIEESYDSVLKGIDGSGRYEVGQGVVNLGQEIPGGYHEETPPQPGRSVQLTIDRDLQFEIQRILGEQMARVNADAASAVVLDVVTGEVLAQASYPFYDAANPLASPPADRGDMASGMAVDPGSVHKAIVMAGCLQEGVVAPTDTIRLPATITKGSTTFDDSHWHPPMAAFTLPGILAWSSNVGAITLADRLGAQKLYEYQRAFGLGEPTGEGLPGEATGLVQPPQNWSADAYGSIPIGLGVSATPLQMAAVYATIANGGVYVRPHLVKALVEPNGASTPMPDPLTRRVISVETATALRSMLEAVVTAPDATGRAAAINGYRVAGKTGTGMLVVNGAYAPGEVGSFIGMAPADAPRYVVAVFAHTPGGSGGTVAAPAFAQMMEQTLLRYRVPPSGTRPPTFTIYS
jgi:cell division protein FtsI (penicillin-binding protein 3)